MFRTYTKDQADVVQLTVTGLPAGARLRLAALDAYDGRQFTLSNGEGPFVRIGRNGPAPTVGAPTTVTVEHQELRRSVPAAARADHALDFTGTAAAQLTPRICGTPRPRRPV